MRHALDGEVVGLGGAGGENDFAGLGIHQRRRLRRSGVGEHALGSQARGHFLRHARIHRRSRGVIHINDLVGHAVLRNLQASATAPRRLAVIAVSAVSNASTLSALLSIPKLTRTALRAVASSSPMASSTWLGLPLLLWQAEPLDTAMPRRSSSITSQPPS